MTDPEIIRLEDIQMHCKLGNHTPTNDNGSSRKGVKMTRLDLHFKISVFTALTKNGITASQLLSKSKQNKTAINGKLERILNWFF